MAKRDALDREEFNVLASAIGVIGDSKLRRTLATEVWEILQRHTTQLYGGTKEYEKKQWGHLCRIQD